MIFIKTAQAVVTKKQRCIGANVHIRYQCNILKRAGQESLTLGKAFDSPVIYGARVETSNPYHLGYIENSFIFTLAYLDYQ